MTAALAVLMRWPRPGEGKTRLAAQIGVTAAHRLHSAFVADTLGWPAPRPRLLAVSPDDDAVAEARRCAPDAVVVRQAHGDLGVRIAAALSEALHGDAAAAVLVGTDSPSLPHRLLMACLSAGAAMVPAEDGGFVALAISREAVARHGLDWLRSDGIEWSTAHTAAQTLAAARRAGLSLALTAPWYDVDGAADLPRLHADLRADPGRAPHTLRCLEALDDAPDAVELAS
jgi:uncharacterized protein